MAPIAEDASTPAIATGASTGDLVTASFTPPAGSLLIALVAAGFQNSPTVPGITLADSTGTTWGVGPTQGSSVGSWLGRVSIFFRYVYTSAAMTVTASYTNLSSDRYLAVRVINNGAVDEANAGTATKDITTAATAWTQSITTKKSGSVVYAVCDDPVAGDTITAAANTTLINANIFADAVASACGKATAATGAPGAITLGFTVNVVQNGCLAMLEVLPEPLTPVVGSEAVARSANW